MPGMVSRGEREQPMTVAPARSSSWAMPTPTPRLVPVTIAILPSRMLINRPSHQAVVDSHCQSVIPCHIMSKPSKLRVIQWATGGVGKAAIECVLNHPELKLVGCWVHSADKNGRDVGDILGTAALGIAAISSIDEVLALDADCVVYSPLVPNDDEVIAILRSGKNVVTPVGWVYPDPGNARHQAVADAAVQNGVTLHGSGIHPGGITERFPLMISSLSSAV